MRKSLTVLAISCAALLGPLAAAQAQVRLNPPKSNLPTGGGFAVKNGSAFANQGGIAAGAMRAPSAGSLISNSIGSCVTQGGGNRRPGF